jgi:hypothetical protein
MARRLRLGKPATGMDAPAHTPGVMQGNSRGNYERQAGMLEDGRRTAAASTGVGAGKREPIDPSMPNLPPA